MGDHWAFRETFRWSQKKSFFQSSYTHTLLYKQGVCQLLHSPNILISHNRVCVSVTLI